VPRPKSNPSFAI